MDTQDDDGSKTSLQKERQILKVSFQTIYINTIFWRRAHENMKHSTLYQSVQKETYKKC